MDDLWKAKTDKVNAKTDKVNLELNSEVNTFLLEFFYPGVELFQISFSSKMFQFEASRQKEAKFKKPYNKKEKVKLSGTGNLDHFTLLFFVLIAVLWEGLTG